MALKASWSARRPLMACSRIPSRSSAPPGARAASPSAPPPETVSAEQSHHLVEFVRRLVALLGSSEPEAVAGFTRLGS